MPHIPNLKRVSAKHMRTQLLNHPTSGTHLIRAHDHQLLTITGTIKNHILRRYVMRHRNGQHLVTERTPLPHHTVIGLILPMERKISIETLRIRIRHIPRIMRRHTNQNLRGRINITEQTLTNILTNLIQPFEGIMPISLLLNMNNRKAINEQRRIKTTIRITSLHMLTPNLIHNLIRSVASTNLILLEHRQNHRRRLRLRNIITLHLH